MGARRRNWEFRGSNNNILLSFNPVVFIGSVGSILALLLLTILYLDGISVGVADLQAWIANRAGWFFVLVMNLILAYLVYLALSRHSKIRLGGKDARPEFSTAAWFTMLFSAGMGIGLMFYSVAEPMYHLINPPHGAEPRSLLAYRDAMATTYLHWGFHAWGVYALMGVALAFLAYNQHQPLNIRALFQPVLGDRIHGWAGDFIDMLATVATLFGVATSLGLGAFQINAGLASMFGWQQSATVQIYLIAFITVIATGSVILGVDRGIRRLSNLNMIIAGLVLGYIIIAGPTQFILDGFVQNTGQYLDSFFFLSFWTETYTGGHWQNGWTVFYWGWWIAWSPFVGTFLARISYGRTIREFIIAVLLVTTGFTFIWLSAFGGTALYMEMNGITDLATAVEHDISQALYEFLAAIPAISNIVYPRWLLLAVSLICTLAIVGFFVTSSDSGSLVIDIITAGGHPDPPTIQRIFWAVLEGVVAAILLVTGGLTALQTATISVGLPFAVLLLVLIISFDKVLRREHTESAR
jgi:choline/glycine/proline betaine transport protein